MNKLWLTFVCMCVLGVSAYGQLIVKNSGEETVMQVTNEGKVEIADSLKIKVLENNSNDDASLIGVDKYGTLIKSDQTLLENGY